MWFLIWPVSYTDGTMLLCWLVTYFFSMRIYIYLNMYVCLWCLNHQSALCIKYQANINTRSITMMMMTISNILCMHQKDIKIPVTTTIMHCYVKYFSSQSIQKWNKKKQSEERRKQDIPCYSGLFAYPPTQRGSSEIKSPLSNMHTNRQTSGDNARPKQQQKPKTRTHLLCK